MEEFSMEDPTQLLESAADFAHHPGTHNDASVREFLDLYPLPVIFSALQTKADVPGLVNTLVACLERIFKTKYGASLIPHYMTFLQVGLSADSEAVRCLACKAVSSLLESSDKNNGFAAKLVIDSNLYPLLLVSLINGNEEVAAASVDAIKCLACFHEGMTVIFPTDSNSSTHLRSLAAKCTSLGRVRILGLIVKLFSLSSAMASTIYDSGLLELLEAEVSGTNDLLVTMSVLELLYELTEIRHGSEFLSRTNLLGILCSTIRNTSQESILRSRAILISGRLLSQDIPNFVDDSSIQTLISNINERLESLESLDKDECEAALEALGQIGSSFRGADLLLSSNPIAVKHVIDAAFDRHVRGRQLAALHALGNISGESRPEDQKLLSRVAEENLRRLIYETASSCPKLTPSRLFLSILQHESEIRIAGYRLLTGLVSRAWCFIEICSNQEIITKVTDPQIETTKIGMEAKYNCCKAIHKAFRSSSQSGSDPVVAEMAEKLNDAVTRGPYLARKHIEAQPAVMTAERF